jgi:hypothetical protein
MTPFQPHEEGCHVALGCQAACCLQQTKDTPSSPMLAFADDSLQFHVEVDSSGFMTGAVLSQQSPADEKWHPIAFSSKLLNAVE